MLLVLSKLLSLVILAYIIQNTHRSFFT